MGEIKQLFLIGDIVKLKTGGPKMTINGLETNMVLGSNNRPFNGNVNCTWFENDKLKEHKFHQDTLVKP